MSEIYWEAYRAGAVLAQTLLWPGGYWPVIVQGGDETNVFRRRWQSTLAERMIVVGVWTFIGLDRGDIVEVDIDVYGQGIPLARRSMHKEGIATYDAWKYHPVGPGVSVHKTALSIVCRVNGENITLPDDSIERGRDGNRLSARVHYGLQVVGFKD